MTLQDSIQLTTQSLAAYGPEYKHWAIAFSGGKDSSATATLVIDLIRRKQIQAPESITVLYADTRMELVPLQDSAMRIMARFRELGIKTQVVFPEMDDRFYVYMFGRGVPPPSNTFRWCTSQLKIEPMEKALAQVAIDAGYGEMQADPINGKVHYVGNGSGKLLMLTGVRVGESAARDQRIALSCSKNGSECGQGWFQTSTPAAIADTLAPLLHWRVCHVWDWLMFDAPEAGYPTESIADAYGGEEAEKINARTGCVGCNLASRDTALERVIKNQKWAYLAPLLGLRQLYAELKRPQNRLRKDGSERRKDGVLSSNPMRMGPLTMDARMWGLEEVAKIEYNVNKLAKGMPPVSLINIAEWHRIVELIAANTWPHGWTGDEPVADVMMDDVVAEGVIQPIISNYFGG